MKNLLQKGLSYHQAGQLQKAEIIYNKLLDETKDPDALHLLGLIFCQRGHFNQAIEPVSLAIELDPQPHYYNTLGNAYKGVGQYEVAIGFYKDALRLKPDYAEVYNNLGATYQDMTDLKSAVGYYQEALKLKSEYNEAYNNLADIFQMMGQTQEALKLYQKSYSIHPNDAQLIQMSTILPPIYKSLEQLKNWRTRLINSVDHLLEKGLKLPEPEKEILIPNFFLAYQGFDDKELQIKIAKLYREFLPEQILPIFLSPPDKKIKIGFISRHISNHTIASCYKDLIDQLAKTEELSITFFVSPSTNCSQVTSVQNKVENFIKLPKSMDETRKAIIKQDLDILVYTDLGNDPYTYFLSFTRLAPIQCVLSGFPNTTGINTIDYFLSNLYLEPLGKEAAKHYSEELVLFEKFPFIISKPKKPKVLKTKKDFDLPLNKNLYLCPATLFKLHPAFDSTFNYILEQDPKGILICFKDSHYFWHETLIERFEKTMGLNSKRVLFKPLPPPKDFKCLLHHIDVLLDTFPFCTGTESLTALGLGIPIVTYPSPFLKGGITAGFYRYMDMQDCVAKSSAEYVQIATKLATDKNYNQEIRQKILAKNQILFDNHDIVSELKDFFIKAIEEKR